MQLSATITLLRDDQKHEETLATLAFAMPPDRRPSLVIQHDIPVPASTPIGIGSAYLLENGNLSFAIFHGGKQYLLGLCQWDTTAPHFGVRLPGVGFLNAYLKKTDSDEAHTA